MLSVSYDDQSERETLVARAFGNISAKTNRFHWHEINYAINALSYPPYVINTLRLLAFVCKCVLETGRISIAEYDNYLCLV